MQRINMIMILKYKIQNVMKVPENDKFNKKIENAKKNSNMSR